MGYTEEPIPDDQTMTMLHTLVHRLEGLIRSAPQDPEAREALREALADVPWLSTSLARQDELIRASRVALDHAARLMADLGEPRELHRDSFSRDPLIKTLFTTPHDFARTLSSSPELARLGTSLARPDASITFLLSFFRREREILEVGPIDSRCGVVESFESPSLLAPAPSLEETERLLGRLLVIRLITDAAKDLLRVKSSGQELKKTQEELKAKLHLVDLEEQGLGDSHADKSSLEAKRSEIAGEMALVERDMEALSPRLAGLAKPGGTVARYLVEAADHLRIERISLSVDEFGVKHETSDPARCQTIQLTELAERSGGRRTLVLCRARPEELEAIERL